MRHAAKQLAHRGRPAHVVQEGGRHQFGAGASGNSVSGALEGVLKLVDGLILVKKAVHGGQSVTQFFDVALPRARAQRHLSLVHTGPASGDR